MLMKIFSAAPPDQTPVPRSKAWSCLITNLLVMPGLGSVMAGYKSGFVQMALALAGFVATLAAMFSIGLAWAREFQLPDDRRLYGLLLIGVAVFVVSWAWSLLTSLAVFRRSQS
jgi:hypothetical protein